jgi:hypothetical protein
MKKGRPCVYLDVLALVEDRRVVIIGVLLLLLLLLLLLKRTKGWVQLA